MADPNKFSGYLSYEDGEQNEVFLDFDAFISEQHATSAEISTHPVEEGSKFSDHIRVNPDRLTVEAIVTNTPIYEFKLSDSQGMEPTERELQTETRFVPIGIPSAVVQRIKVLESVSDFDRCRSTYDEIVSLCKAAVRVKCVTELRTYENMAIGNISTPVDVGAAPNNSLRFTFELSELRFASTETVSASAKQKKKKINRSDNKKNKGAQSGKQAKRESSLHSGKEAGANAIKQAAGL